MKTLSRTSAVVQCETRSLARQKTPFVLRTLFAALVGLIALSTIASVSTWSPVTMAAIGYSLFYRIVLIQTFLALAFGALLGVTSINAERHNQTLGLLALSQLHPWEIVLGKLAALFALVLIVLIAGLPVFAVLSWLGGLEFQWLGWLLAYTVVITLMGISTGLATALRYRSSAAATILAMTVLALPILGSQAMLTNEPTSPLVLLASPATACFDIASQVESFSVQVGLFVALLWTVVAVMAASRSLPKAAASGEGRGLRGFFEDLDVHFEKINKVTGGVRVFESKQRALTGNPVAWLTSLTGGLGLAHYGVRLVVAGLGLALLSLAFALLGPREGLIVISFWTFALLVIPLSLGALSFGAERSRQTLSVLLATPMAPWEILWGKLRASAALLTVLAIGSTLFLWAFLSLQSANGWLALTSMLSLTCTGLCGYAMAQHLSLIQPNALRAGIFAALLLAGQFPLFMLGRAYQDLSLWRKELLAAVVVLTLGGVLTAVAAMKRGRTSVAMIALCVAVTPSAALLTSLFAEKFVFDAEVLGMNSGLTALVLTVVLMAFNARSFDMAVGRAR